MVALCAIALLAGQGLASVPEADATARTPVRAAAAQKAAQKAKRPNIVMVMADDMRADDIRYMPKTRRLLGKGGLTFENSFAPNPLCCPSRASFLTGQYSHNHKVYSHVKPWGFGAFNDRYTMATALKDAGYNTALVGKYLNGYGRERSKVTGKPSLHYRPRGYTDWYAGIEAPKGSGLGGIYNYFRVTYNHNGRLDDKHRGEYSTTGIGAISRRLITKYHRAGKPFFVYASFVAPHFGAPVEPEDPRKGLGPGQIGLFRSPALPNWVKGRFDKVINRAPGDPRGGGKFEADMSDKPKYMQKEYEYPKALRRAGRELARQRAESVFVLDKEVARIVRTLKQKNEWKNTVLMFTSDNGYYMGEHRQRPGKIKGHEPSIRVPFLVTGPGMRQGEKRYDPITTIDVSATILELAGATGKLTRKHPIDGASRVETMRSGDVGWLAPVVTEGHLWPHPNKKKAKKNGFKGRGRSYIGIRTAQYSLIRYISGATELYDLENDANQMESRHASADYKATKKQLTDVWYDYKDCKGASCQRPLPEDLRSDPQGERTLTQSFWSQVKKMYGY